MGFKDYLNEMNSSWVEGRDTPPGIPDGDYPMRLIGLKVHESKQQKGKYSLMRTSLVLDGEFAGEEVTDFISLAREGWMFYVSQFIRAVGSEPPADANDLESLFAEIESAQPCYMANVRASTGSELRNVTVKELIEDPGSEPAAAPAKAPTKTASTPVKGPVKKPAAPEKSTISVGIGTHVQFETTDGPTIATVTGHGDDGILKVETESGDAYELAVGEYTFPETTDDVAQVQEEDQDAETIAGIVAIFQSNGIEGVPETPTLEDLKTIAKDYDFQKEELTAEEIELLGKIGASIVEPAPKPKPVVKAPVKAPVKPAPAAKAPVKKPAAPAAKAPVKKPLPSKKK